MAKFEIHIHVHQHLDQTVEAKLDTIVREIRASRREQVMLYTDITALIDDINAATNVVAGKMDGLIVTIADLQAQIAAGTPVTQAQLDALGASLQAEKDVLVALGADPANPIPTP